MYESEINKALRNLNNQHIPVGPPRVDPPHVLFEVMGYLLTGPQIVDLNHQKKLHSRGIREFAEKLEPPAKE